MSELKQSLFAIVNRVPRGQVTSFWTLSKILESETGRSISAQMVGRLLSGMSRDEWNQCCRWRVVNKDGFISSIKLWEKWLVQAQLLEGEGVEVRDGRVVEPEWREN